MPTNSPTTYPTANPTFNPTDSPSDRPTLEPTYTPTVSPTQNQTVKPTEPTFWPTYPPTGYPMKTPSNNPTYNPSNLEAEPTFIPIDNPTTYPSVSQNDRPTFNPRYVDTGWPTVNPSFTPTRGISTTTNLTQSPWNNPTSFQNEGFVDSIGLLHYLLISLCIGFFCLCACCIKRRRKPTKRGALVHMISSSMRTDNEEADSMTFPGSVEIGKLQTMPGAELTEELSYSGGEV